MQIIPLPVDKSYTITGKVFLIAEEGGVESVCVDCGEIIAGEMKTHFKQYCLYKDALYSINLVRYLGKLQPCE